MNVDFELKEDDKDDFEFEIIDDNDYEEALRTHIASIIMSHPDIKKMNMKPDELSKVVKKSINSSIFQRKSIVRLWSYGQTIYRYSSIGYTAFVVYQHPIIVKLAIIGFWTAGKATIGLF